jgi:hypothetical protein
MEDNNDSDVMLEEEFLRKNARWNPGEEEGESPRRAKYKPKCFKCPECGKGYVSLQRLRNHIDSRHLKPNDPFSEVGPNTDIAVYNPATEAGFDLYKVLGVYTTGLRFKCAKFLPAANGGHDAWILTEEVNKNVAKKDILRVVKTMRRISSESVVPIQYGIGTAELVTLLQMATGMSAGSRQQPGWPPGPHTSGTISAAGFSPTLFTAEAGATGNTANVSGGGVGGGRYVNGASSTDVNEGLTEEAGEEEVENEIDDDEDEEADEEEDEDDEDEEDLDEDDDEDDEEEDDDEVASSGGRGQIMVQPVFEEEEGLDMEVETE